MMRTMNSTGSIVLDTSDELQKGGTVILPTVNKDDWTPQHVIAEMNAHKQIEVDSPKHYQHGRKETIDIITDVLSDMQFTARDGFYIGNIIKYLSRCRHKNGIKDLEKAEWYLKKMIEEWKRDIDVNAHTS